MRLRSTSISEFALAALLVAAALSAAALGDPCLASRAATVSALAEAGATDLSGRGADSPFGNPATLAWNPRLSVRIGSGAALLQNDTYTWHDYSRWNGEHWTEADKVEILTRIGEDGAEGRFAASLLTPALAWAGWALSAQNVEEGRLRVPREYADLVLFGNRVGQSIDLPASSGERTAFFDIALSHGRTVSHRHGWELSVGASAHWLHGLAYDELSSASGTVTTDLHAIDGEFTAESRTSEGGRGYALDFGIALRSGSPHATIRPSNTGAGENRGDEAGPTAERDASPPRTAGRYLPSGIHGPYEFGIALRNAIGAIRWSENPQHHVDRARADSVTVESGDEDDPIETSGQATAIDPFSRRLPPEVTLSGALWASRFRFELGWTQGFEERIGTTKTPRVALGSSFWGWTWVTPKAGLSVGGIDGPVLALGAQVRFRQCHLDLAYQTLGGVDLSLPKGVALGLALTWNRPKSHER